MPFAFSKLQPIEGGRVSEIQIPLGQYLSNAFTQGVHDSMFSSIAAMEELDLEKEGRFMSATEANDTYGLGGRLNFTEPIYESQARLLRDRKEAEMRRSFYLSMGNPDGFFSARGAAGLGASIVGNILNPLDFAINFVPIVGSEAAGLRAAKLGRGAFRQRIERGLVTAETLGKYRYPKLVTSLVNAGVGNVVAEVPHLISALESKEDYTVSESIVNVLAGTALGTALHLGLTQAVALYDRLTPPTKEVMLKEAVDQFLTGKQIDVTKYVEIDENAIRQSVKFDEVLARERAIQQVDIGKIKSRIKEKIGELPVQAAVRFSDGTIRSGDAHYLINLDDIDASKFNTMVEGFVTDKGRFITREQAAEMSGRGGFGPAGDPNRLTAEDILPSSDPEFLDPFFKDMFERVKDAGATDAEAMSEVRRIQRERADIAFFSRPDIIQRIETEKNRRIKALITRERNKYDEQGRFIAARDAEIQRQIREGRVLNDQQKKDWNFSKKTAEETIATVKEQIAELTEELKDELTPEDTSQFTKKSALDKIDDVLKKLKIEGPGSGTAEGVTGLPVWLWNGAIEAVRAALKAGRSLAEAIDAGVKHLRSERKDVEVTEKMEQQFQKAVREKLAPKKPLDVSRRTFLNILSKATGVTTVSPMGVVKAIGEGVTKTVAKEAVKKTLLPNLSLFELIRVADRKILEQAETDFKGVVGEEALAKWDPNDTDPIDAWSEWYLPTREDHPLKLFLHTEESYYDVNRKTGLADTLVNHPLVNKILRENPSFREGIEKLTKKEEQGAGFDDDYDNRESTAFMLVEDRESKFGKILQKLESSPLSELELKGEISPEMVANLNKALQSISEAFPEIRDMIKAAADAAESRVVKEVADATTKAEKSAIDQALDCLLKNPVT